MAIIKRSTQSANDAADVAPKIKKVSLHDQMVLRAERWLEQQGCGVVIRDPFRSVNQEQPDAIGWRSGVSILIEVKASRSDFLSDKNKAFRAKPEEGMGDWRFYMSPPDIIKPEDLPEGWGLLWVRGKKIQKVHGVPPNSWWVSKKPFTGDKANENTMLLSALRRLKLRGYLPQIYDGVLTAETNK